MRRLLAGAVLAVVAAGCAVGPSYRRPAPVTPEAWREPSGSEDSLRPFFDSLAANADSLALPPGDRAADARPDPANNLPALLTPAVDSAVNVEWFDLLQDATLRALVDTALRQNRDVRVAVATINEYRALYSQSKAPLFPQIAANGTFARQRFIFGTFPPTISDAWRVTGDVSWELDFWGNLRRNAQAGRQDLLSKEESQRAVVLTLVSDVATAYLELRELDQELAITRRTLDTRRETLRLARRRYDQGLISELDVRQFESEVAGPAVSLADFERQVALKENQLSVLIGRYPGGIPRGQELTETVRLIDLPAGVPSNLLERRPDVRAAEADLHAATARIGVALGGLLPSFTVTGQYGGQSDVADNLFKGSSEIYTIQGGISVPLFTGGRLRGQVGAARARAEQARYRYEQTVLGALQEVENAMVTVRTARDQLAAQQTQVKALRRAFSLANVRYQNGVSSYLDLLDAQRSLFSAELALVQAERQQLVAAVQLYKALGGGWPKGRT